MNKWKTRKKDTLLDTHWVKVYKNAVDLPNGESIKDFYSITINDSAAVVAVDKVGNVILKKEYRYCYGKELIEIPAGTFEKNEKDALNVAKRELLEETGYMSDDWLYLGETIESSAKLTNHMHIYFANACYKVSEQNLDKTEEIETMVVPFVEAIEMVMDNRICCNSSAHGILRVARILGI